MIYSNSPKALFREKLESILADSTSKNKKSNLSILEDIYKLFQIFKQSKLVSLNPSQKIKQEKNIEILLTLLNELGIQTFVKILLICDGKQVQFPDVKDIEEDLIAALCYYYRIIENKSWEEIKEILKLPDLNTIKYGILLRQFKEFFTTYGYEKDFYFETDVK